MDGRVWGYLAPVIFVTVLALPSRSRAQLPLRTLPNPPGSSIKLETRLGALCQILDKASTKQPRVHNPVI